MKSAHCVQVGTKPQQIETGTEGRETWTLASLSSAKVKPRPALIRILYLMVGQRTTGLSRFTGRGASLFALAKRWVRRFCLSAGWSNHVCTRRAQSLRKCWLAMTWLCFMTPKQVASLIVQSLQTWTLPTRTSHAHTLTDERITHI